MLLSKAKRTAVRRIFREFLRENTVSAIRFIANHRLLKFERSWWAFWVVASLGTCYYSAVITYRKWYENPVVIAYAPRFVSMRTVPFPAITICPLSKTRVEVFNVTHVFEQWEKGTALDDDSKIKLRTLAHVCPTSILWAKFKPDGEENIVPMLKNMSFPLNMVMQWCERRRKRRILCSEMISESLTDDGICYTFNALRRSEIYRADEISPDFLNFNSTVAASNWTQETGYPPGEGSNAYPYRTASGGIQSGIFMLHFIRKVDQEFLCRGPYTGFKITVHPPDEVAMTGDRFFRLNTLNALILSIQPRVIFTSPELRKTSPIRRNCLFNSERHLRYFRIYTQTNCIAECIANLTLARCGCVKFSMPRSATTKVCDASKIACYSNTTLEVFEQATRAQLLRRPTPCRCYPACNSVQYDAEIFQFPFDFARYSAATGGLMNPYKFGDPSAAFVFMKDRRYLPLWRRELYGVVDAVAKFGSLFALLMGASVLSLGEILYYCCVRPLRRERRPIAATRIYVLPWKRPY